MPKKLTIYQKPTCSKCRETLAIVREAKVPFDTVDYFSCPLSATTLRRLLSKLSMSPRDILRTSEPTYAKLELGKKTVSDDELIKLMVIYPELIQRPIVEAEERAVLGRPPENVKALL